MNQPININEKFSKFSEHWRPKIVAQLNGQDFKLAKIKGEYPFHAHEHEDEMFFCWKGSFILDFEHGESVAVGEVNVSSFRKASATDLALKKNASSS